MIAQTKNDRSTFTYTAGKASRAPSVSIDKRARAYVDKVLSGFPGEGSGLHNWLYATAASISPFFATIEDVEGVLEHTIAGSVSKGRAHSIRREIQDAARNGRVVGVAPDWLREARGEPIATARSIASTPLVSRWPKKDYKRILELATRAPYPLAEVLKHSPVPIDGDRMTEAVIDSLFPGDPLLCIASAVSSHKTARRSEWRGRLSGSPLMVPNAMASKWGDKATGGRSQRCLSNTGPRRYLVVEFDFAKHTPNGKPSADLPLLLKLEAGGMTVGDLCSTIICDLQGGDPELRLITSSGGKSLHSWWDCQCLTDEQIEVFFHNACSLGADPATWTPCQLVRIPDGTRENGTHQKLHLFNPARI